MRKLAYSLVALLVLASGTFAVAPMAFCRVQKEASSCCEKPAKKANHCTDKHADCPICSHELCKVDPTPAKPATAPVSVTADIVTVSAPAITFEAIPVASVSAPTIIDSGPPIYLLDCVFRI